jgi:hypothetical protein
MNNFGIIKTKLEKASTELFGKKNFSNFMKDFKTNILENKDISEIFYIYDDLSSKKGLSRDIAEDYINESIEYCQILIESNKKRLSVIDKWASKLVNETENKYSNIDTIVYSKSIKNLESVLESKKQILNTLLSEEKVEQKIKSINLPISTMVKVAEENIKNEINNLTESEKNEIISIVSLSKEELEKEFKELQEGVINNLKSSLNESKESDMKSMIEKTIEKISDSKTSHYDLYKLRKLKSGL